jgi:hypothetical protein
MAGIWDIGKPSVTVEKRKITPRKREPKTRPLPLKEQVFRKPDGPIAREVSHALRDEPIRFPSHWIK